MNYADVEIVFEGRLITAGCRACGRVLLLQDRDELLTLDRLMEAAENHQELFHSVRF